MKLNIATLIALLTVVDHSSSHVLATTKTSEYETTPKQEQEGDVVVVAPLLPTLLRGAKKAVYQFLSDGDSEELSCGDLDDDCESNDDCCGDNVCFDLMCAEPCADEDDDCESNDDCCGDYVCTSYNMCEEYVPCVNLGDPCDPDTPCCGDLYCDDTDIGTRCITY